MRFRPAAGRSRHPAAPARARHGPQLDDFENFLLLLDLQAMCAAMVSTRRPGSSMLLSDDSTSAGTFLPSCTYCSNCDSRCARTLRLALGGLDFVDQADFGTDVAVDFAETLDRAALLAFDQHLDGAIRQLQQLQHGGNGTDAVQGVLTRIIVGRVFLGQQEDLLSPVIAASRASMDFSRPTNSGITMCG
jgi:hypothetical protein